MLYSFTPQKPVLACRLLMQKCTRLLMPLAFTQSRLGSLLASYEQLTKNKQPGTHNAGMRNGCAIIQSVQLCQGVFRDCSIEAKDKQAQTG